MSQSYVQITTGIRGSSESWSTVHTVGSALSLTWEILASEIGVLDEQLAEKIASQTFTRVGTNYTLTFGSLTPTFLERLVAFHRLMTNPLCEVRKIFIHDGKKDARKFKSVNLFNATGKFVSNETDNDNTLAIGTATLHIVKNASGLSNNNGDMYLRGVLNDDDIVLSSRPLIAFTSPATKTKYSNHLSQALSLSGLGAYFSGDSAFDNLCYAIPKIAPEGVTDGHVAGDLIGYTPVMSMAVDEPKNRQVRRYNRKKKAEVSQSFLDTLGNDNVAKIAELGLKLVATVL